MMVNYRIHAHWGSRTDQPYAVEQEVATDVWSEVNHYGARLRFRSALGAVEFIMALDDHRGNFTHQGLVDSMVVN